MGALIDARKTAGGISDHEMACYAQTPQETVG